MATALVVGGPAFDVRDLKKSSEVFGLNILGSSFCISKQSPGLASVGQDGILMDMYSLYLVANLFGVHC